MSRNSEQGVISHWHHSVDNFNTSALDFYASVEEALTARELPAVTTERVTFKEGGLASAKREYLRVRRERLIFDICAAPYGNGFFFSWWLSKEQYSALPWVILLLLVGSAYGSALLHTFQRTMQSQMEMAFTGQQSGGGCAVVWLLVLTPFVIYGLGKGAQAGVFGSEETVVDTPIVGRLYVFLFGATTYFSLDTTLMFQESARRAVQEALANVRTEKGLRALRPEETQPTLRMLSR